MIKKTNYEAPETELILVRFEDAMLTLSTQENTIQNATIDSWDEEL